MADSIDVIEIVYPEGEQGPLLIAETLDGKFILQRDDGDMFQFPDMITLVMALTDDERARFGYPVGKDGV